MTTWECKLCTNWNDNTEVKCKTCGVNRPINRLPSKSKKLGFLSIYSTKEPLLKTQEDSTAVSRGLPETRSSSKKLTGELYVPPNSTSFFTSGRSAGGQAEKGEASATDQTDKKIAGELYVAPNSTSFFTSDRTAGGQAEEGETSAAAADKPVEKKTAEETEERSNWVLDKFNGKTGKNAPSDGMTTHTADSDEFSRDSDGSDDFSENAEQEQERLQRSFELLAPTWQKKYNYSPHYSSRLVNFKFAQQKRAETYGTESPWGILGLYEHLSAVRADVKWADEVERRRKANEP